MCTIRDCFYRCCRILATLRHPNVVAYHDSFFDEHEERLFIVQVSFVFYKVHAKLGRSSVFVVKVLLSMDEYYQQWMIILASWN